MSEKNWRLYASNEVVVYTSSSANDPLAAEECRAWAVSRWSEDPVPPGCVVIGRVKPGVAGRHSVRLLVPRLHSLHASEEGARDFEASEEGSKLTRPIIVKVGSEDELAVLRLAAEVSRHG